MAEPATQPNSSFTNVKPRKLKGPKEKSQRQRQQQNKVAVSPDDAGATTTMTTTRRITSAAAAAVASAAATPATPKDADYDVEFGDFDYDAVKADEGAELWLVRAPTSVKAKNLHGLEVAHRVGLVGDLIRKNAAYDVWALDPAPAAAAAAGGAQAPASRNGSGNRGELGGARGAPAHVGHVGAEELNNLSVLLPCKRKGGKRYLAPKPVTRHLVVAARIAKPTDAAATAFENPKREAYPDEVLTHRFRPYGDPGDPPPDSHMEVDAAEVSAKEKKRHKRRDSGETGSSKRKKAKLVAS